MGAWGGRGPPGHIWMEPDQGLKKLGQGRPPPASCCCFAPLAGGREPYPVVLLLPWPLLPPPRLLRWLLEALGPPPEPAEGRGAAAGVVEASRAAAGVSLRSVMVSSSRMRSSRASRNVGKGLARRRRSRRG